MVAMTRSLGKQFRTFMMDEGELYFGAGFRSHQWAASKALNKFHSRRLNKGLPDGEEEGSGQKENNSKNG